MSITMEHSGTTEIGSSRRRKEDAHLITGQTVWTDNIRLPGMVHLAFKRSPMAHARVRGLDVSPALGRPGVLAAYAAADLAADTINLPCAWPVTPDMVHPDHHPLAPDEVRHVGDPVAVVVAADRFAAADAVEAIEVEFDPLPAVVDMEAAVADGAPLVHGDAGTNACYRWPFATGDYQAARRAADVVVSRRYVNQRLIASAMEPRSVVVVPTPATGEFTVYSATQVPHILRLMLCQLCGIPEHKLRVVAPDVGGGFGSKLDVYAEEVVALLVARELGVPVKYTETRSEGCQTTVQGRDQIQRIEVAARRDGTLLGLKVDLLADMGAYLQLVTPGIPVLGAFMYPGIYKMDAYSFDCTGVFTTKTPTDAYRGAGRPEATFAIERVMDDLAAELGMDPIELRRKNWIAHEEFPYTTIAGLTYDSGNYEAATGKALRMFGYDELRAEQRQRRDRDDPVQLGIGVSTYTEMCGLAPSRVLGSLSYGAGGWEAATVRVLPTGKVEVVTGISPHGQGHETGFSQVVADTLGVPFEDIEIIHGDTRSAPQGMDTYGSRSLVVGGVAVYQAARRVRDKARRIAAHLLEANPDDVEFADGTFRVKGAPGPATTMAEVALATFTAHNLPDGVEPSLFAECVFDPENFSFPHGTHLCAAEVDTETGRVTIRRYVAVDDCGTVVNPLLVEGQVVGGIAEAIGQALYEHAVYDADGNLLTGTFADYLVPGAPDLPAIDTGLTQTPATSNPLGVKGVGEAGTIGGTPCVVNAIVDALRPYDVTDVPMPATPQTVWRAIQQAKTVGTH
ncbi:xanthine dehydrogenase family protein molybdopterin-binding subunit [Pseudonocardia asaccharolytica]|nr:xanthine dehydrogenase family protein molybdopterin-binding subunit [Pseudonocardia asaccharolytica]